MPLIIIIDLGYISTRDRRVVCQCSFGMCKALHADIQDVVNVWFQTIFYKLDKKVIIFVSLNMV